MTALPWVELRPVRWDADDGVSDCLWAYWRDLGVRPPERWHRRYLERLAAEDGRERFTFWGHGADRRIGLVVLRIEPDWVERERRIGYICEFTVLPAFRRQGWGRAQFAAAAAWLLARGCASIELDVLVGNGRGRAFWLACGCRPAYEHLRWDPRP